MKEYPFESKCVCGGISTLKYLKRTYKDIEVTITNVPHYVCEFESSDPEHVRMARRTRIHLKRCLVHVVAEGIKEMEYSEELPVGQFEVEESENGN